MDSHITWELRHVWPVGLPLATNNILERSIIEHRFCKQAFQLGVLCFKHLESLCFEYGHTVLNCHFVIYNNLKTRMDNATLFSHIDRLRNVVRGANRDNASFAGAKAQITEFLREFAGSKSSFLKLGEDAFGSPEIFSSKLIATLESFRSYIDAGLRGEIFPVVEFRFAVHESTLGGYRLHPSGKS